MERIFRLANTNLIFVKHYRLRFHPMGSKIQGHYRNLFASTSRLHRTGAGARRLTPMLRYGAAIGWDLIPLLLGALLSQVTRAIAQTARPSAGTDIPRSAQPNQAQRQRRKYQSGCTVEALLGAGRFAQALAKAPCQGGNAAKYEQRCQAEACA